VSVDGRLLQERLRLFGGFDLSAQNISGGGAANAQGV
jgi:hypothetical protein